MENIIKRVHRNLKTTQDRQKHYADKRRSERSFKVGEPVFLRVKPKRSSLHLGKWKKLAPRYCGPFSILEQMGVVAYKLALPPHVKVHNVFHVSLLNKYVPVPSHVLDFDAIQMKETGEFLTEPLRIICSKQQHRQNRVIDWVKVHW